MAGKNEGAAAAGAGEGSGEIGALAVVAAGPEERVLREAGDGVGFVEMRGKAGAFEAGGEELLAGEFGADGGAIFRRGADEAGEEGEKFATAGIDVGGKLRVVHQRKLTQQDKQVLTGAAGGR